MPNMTNIATERGSNTLSAKNFWPKIPVTWYITWINRKMASMTVNFLRSVFILKLRYIGTGNAIKIKIALTR